MTLLLRLLAIPLLILGLYAILVVVDGWRQHIGPRVLDVLAILCGVATVVIAFVMFFNAADLAT